jgi:hypothetical protein
MKLRNSEILTLLMLVAPAALMQQSCTYHDKVTIDERATSPIMVGVASAGTKGIINGNTDADRLGNMVGQCFNGDALKENAGFGVYSYKSTPGKSVILFDNTQVYPDANNAQTAWSYSPTRFWDMTASYQFIAYWPYLPDETSENNPYVSIPDPVDHTAVTEAEKVLTIHNIPYWQPAATGMDVMTSVRVGRYRSITDADGTDFSERDKVGFMFRHVLSNLMIKAYYINGSETPVENGVYIKGITLMKSGDANDVPGKEQDNWKAAFTHHYTDRKANLSGTLEYTDQYALLTSAHEEVNFKNEWVDNPNFVPNTIGSWLVVPHRWNGIKIGVDYTVGGEDKSSMSNPVPTTLGLESEDYMLQSGKTYTLTLLFDVSNGNVTVYRIGVKDWTVQDVTHHVYNW